MSDWIDDPSCRPATLATVGVGADQTINNNTTNDPKTCVDPEECAGTGTKILYAVGGAALGFLGAWFLSDQQKKAAQERVASTARGTADGFRQGWSAPRAANPLSNKQALARQIITDDQLRQLASTHDRAQKERILAPSVDRLSSALSVGSDKDSQDLISGLMGRLKEHHLVDVFAPMLLKSPQVYQQMKALMRRITDTPADYDRTGGPHASWLRENGYAYHGSHYGWVDAKTGRSMSHPNRPRY